MEETRNLISSSRETSKQNYESVLLTDSVTSFNKKSPLLIGDRLNRSTVTGASSIIKVVTESERTITEEQTLLYKKESGPRQD